MEELGNLNMLEAYQSSSLEDGVKKIGTAVQVFFFFFLLYFILFYFILFYFILFYFILFYFILFCIKFLF